MESSTALLGASVLKKLSLATALGLGASSVPITFFSVSSDDAEKVVGQLTDHGPIKSFVTNVLSVASNMTEAPQKLQNEALSQYNEVKDPNRYKDLGEKAKGFEELAPKAYKWTAEEGNVKSANYHVFNLGSAVKTLIKKSPQILKDTIREVLRPDEADAQKKAEYLSLQKIVTLVSQKEFQELLPELQKLGSNRKDVLGKLTEKETVEFLNVLRNVMAGGEDKLRQFLRQVKANVTEIVDADSFKDSRELLIRILFGKDFLTKLEAKKKELKNAYEAVRTKLKDFKITEETIEAVRGILDQIGKPHEVEVAIPKGSDGNIKSLGPAAPVPTKK